MYNHYAGCFSQYQGPISCTMHTTVHKQTIKQKANKQKNKQANKQKTWLDYLLTKYTALFLRVGGNWVSGCSSPAWVRTTNRTRQSPFSRKFRICDMFSSWLVILDHLSGFTCVVITTDTHKDIYKMTHICVLSRVHWPLLQTKIKSSCICPALMLPAKVVNNE